ncbi:MAG: hypothetical protein IPL11_12985 [Candidatus Accumulibacter sp.]|jgi:hypothetical protein|nr:hypothetical protein [Accumulibacter sp.]
MPGRPDLLPGLLPITVCFLSAADGFMVVISPMIDARAQPVAKRLGIETYGDSLDVEIG